jgi:hypothetical protein
LRLRRLTTGADTDGLTGRQNRAIESPFGCPLLGVGVSEPLRNLNVVLVEPVERFG